MVLDRFARRTWMVGCCGSCLAVFSGCLSALFRGDDTVSGVPVEKDDRPYRLIGDLARPWGLDFATVEGVSLVTGLDDTGSDPPPSAQRDVLLSEMRVRKVENSTKVLASNQTSLVLVRGLLPPAAQVGDRFDVEVMVPTRSETTSLRGGKLLLTPIRPLAALDGTIKSGHIMAMAEGSIMDQATLEGSDDVKLLTRGWVLGGGKVTKPRQLGLMLRRDEHWFRLVKEVTQAINGRFFAFNRGQKVGAADAKRDTFVELTLPRRYRRNLTRFMKVALKIPFRFETMSRANYLRDTGQQLLILAHSEDSAVRLEALGDDAVPLLLPGLESPESAVRFYAAEALAYLNRSDGLAVLAAVAEQDAALRLRALTAMGALEDLESHDVLANMLNSESAETRYGAFRVLQTINSQDPTLGLDRAAADFHLYRVVTTGPPMVHISRRERPEIVLFGAQQQFSPHPFVVFAGKQLVLKCEVPGQIAVKRLNAAEEGEVRISGLAVSDVIHALAELDATYPQVVQVLQEAHRQGVLVSRLVFDAAPRSGRSYSPGELQLPTDDDVAEDPHDP